MANTIGLLLLAAPMLLVLFLGLGLLFWRLSKHFADSLIAVIATAIVLPHFASKLLDRAYDAFLANCRIPDDCIDSKRYPLFIARSVLKELIESLQSPLGVKPC